MFIRDRRQKKKKMHSHQTSQSEKFLYSKARSSHIFEGKKKLQLQPKKKQRNFQDLRAKAQRQVTGKKRTIPFSFYLYKRIESINPVRQNEHRLR